MHHVAVGGAAVANGCPRIQPLAAAHHHGVEEGVGGAQTPAMGDRHRAHACHGSGERDPACGGRPNHGAGLGGNVDPEVARVGAGDLERAHDAPVHRQPEKAAEVS